MAETMRWARSWGPMRVRVRGVDVACGVELFRTKWEVVSVVNCFYKF